MSRFSIRLICGMVASAMTAGTLTADLATPLKTSSIDEAFLVRRIAEFFKDGDRQLVKIQIQDFFQKYPDSPLKDHLYAVLGDLYLDEKDYEKALGTYESITDPDLRHNLVINKLQCCYELSLYDKIIDEGLTLLGSDLPQVRERKNEFTFLMAESLYRQSLSESDRDEKSRLAQMAGTFYEDLLETEYSDLSLFALADIYTITHEAERAAETYTRLAHDHPEMKEELLFRAASSLAAYDPKAAIKAYETIIDMGDRYAKEAQFNQLVLHYTLGHYQTVIEAYSKIARTIPESQAPNFEYMLGKSYFAERDYAHALPIMDHYIETNQGSETHKKNAFLVAMTSSYELKDNAAFAKHLERFKTAYPHDAELPKALFMEAMLSQEMGRSQEALAELDYLLETYRDFDQREGLLYEHAFVAHQCGAWQRSKESALSYLIEFPHATHESDAWKLFLADSLEIFKQEELKETPSYGKEQLFGDLVKVLDKESILSDEEKLQYQSLYAKLAYELGHYPKALSILGEHMEALDESERAEAHFLAGLCQIELNHPSLDIIDNLERVLELDPQFPERNLIHVHLFNHYIAVRESTDISEIQSGASDKAAEHLFAAMEGGYPFTKVENRLWLADYYYQQSRFYKENSPLLSETDRLDCQELSKRSIALYENIFHPVGKEHLISLEPHTLYLESEILKLADLLSDQDVTEKIALLTDLVEQQNAHPDWNWSFGRNALFELARAYESHHDLEKALETYSFLSVREKSLNSPIINMAAFHSAKLRFQLLEEGQKAESNEEIHEILTQLKELQIKKNVESEPVHLEAGLEYAYVRSLISESQDRDNRYLFFLNRMADDFKSQNDLISKNYSEMLRVETEKQDIFNLYMQYIEAEKLRLSAKEKLRANELLEAEELNEQALAILFELESSDLAKEYLRPRVLKSIEAISESERF